MTSASFGSQVAVVIRKNVLIRKQRIFGTLCCEVVLPIFVVMQVFLMLYMSKLFVPMSVGNQSYYSPNLPFTEALRECRAWNETSLCAVGVMCDDMSIKCDDPLVRHQYDNIVSTLNQTIAMTSYYTPIKLLAYSNMENMEVAFGDHEIFAGVNIKAISTSLMDPIVDYELRLPSMLLPPDHIPEIFKNVLVGSIMRDNWHGTKMFANAGFSQLQVLVESSIGAAITKALGLVVPQIQTNIGGLLNYPAMEAGLATVMTLQAGAILQMACIGTIIMCALDLVREKQQRLKEYLKIMGLSESAYWTGTLITVLAGVLFGILFVAVICVAIVFKHKGLEAVGLYVVYCISSVTFGFLVSTIAKTTQVATVMVVVWIYVLGSFGLFLVQLDPAIKTVVSLCSPLAFQFSIVDLLRQEQILDGADPTIVTLPAFSTTIAFAMLVFDAVLYLFLSWYISHVAPGDTGVGKPFYFLFTKSFWCPSRNATLGTELEDQVISSIDIDPNYQNFPDLDPYKVGVRTAGLRKVYAGNNGEEPVVAVAGLDLALPTDEIFALLGQNGSGKSTTIGMLTGLLPPTFGEAYIEGNSIRTAMDAARANISICPQHDMLLEEITGRQHLEIFARLKGVPPSELSFRIDQALADVDLTSKQNDAVKTYSGGMKRRLSLAISLVADSAVVFLDEPTSGLDPVSRRRVWDMLKLRKQGKTIVLSTHFMDEADILGDKIGILAYGSLQCFGTPEFLKQRFGLGYSLNVVMGAVPSSSSFKSSADVEDPRVTKLIQSFVSAAKVKSVQGSDVTYLLPFDSIAVFPTLFSAIETCIKTGDLGIKSYGLAMSTLEEVFLETTRRVEAALSNKDDDVDSISDTRDISEKSVLINGADPSAYVSNLTLAGDYDTLAAPTSGHAPAGQQLKALLRTKVISQKRHWKGALCFLLVPLLFVLFSLILTRVSFGQVGDIGSKIWNPDHAVANGANQFDIQHLFGGYGPAYGSRLDVLDFASNFADFKEFLASNFTNADRTSHGAFNITDVDLSANRIDLNIYVNRSNIVSLPESVNFINNAVLNAALENSTATEKKMRISGSSRPFDAPASWFSPESRFNQKAEMQMNTMSTDQYIIMSMVVSLGILGALAGKNIVSEVERSVRLQLQVMSARVWVYWLSHFLGDFVMTLAAMLLIFPIAAAFSTDFLMGNYAAVAVLATFLIIPAVILMDYVFSKLFSTADTCIKWIMALNIGTAAIAYVIIMILQIVVSVASPSQDALAFLNGLSTYITAVSPLATYAAAIHDLSELQSQKIDALADLFGWSGAGKRLVFLIGHVLLASLVLLISEVRASRIVRETFRRTSYIAKEEAVLDAGYVEDSDVKQEVNRIAGGATTDVIKIHDVWKYYGINRAVKAMHLGINPGECFGLLGPNGAGKSTLINMTIGAVSTSLGDIHLGGHPVAGAKKFDLYQAAQLACCFQHDALYEHMTSEEHFRLWLALRRDLSGTSERQLDSYVNRSLARLGLGSVHSRLSKNLSGGNKRKLCALLALLAGNQIVLLDEPSTGMDPSMRRTLWKAIEDQRKSGQCILFTTHTMEEAEAVCSRLGIMVKGQLHALGSTQHLKNKFGGGYILNLTLDTETENSGAVDAFFAKHFAQCKLREAYGKYRSFDLGTIESLASLFALVESNKHSLNITEYSVSQSSFEQVFLHFAKKQAEEVNV